MKEPQNRKSRKRERGYEALKQFTWKGLETDPGPVKNTETREYLLNTCKMLNITWKHPKTREQLKK